MVFVDTDIVIRALRKQNNSVNKQARIVLKKLFEIPPVHITIFNYAELYEGTYWSSNVAKSQRILKKYLTKFNIVPFTQENAENFAQISAELDKKGDDIGDMDKLIASIVIARDDYLYTRNVTHFKRIPNLRIKNWEFNE